MIGMLWMEKRYIKPVISLFIEGLFIIRMFHSVAKANRAFIYGSSENTKIGAENIDISIFETHGEIPF